MFEIDFSSGQILSDKNTSYQRPGEVLFKRDGAKARLSNSTTASQANQHPLDSHDANELHRRLLATYQYELERQAENRMDMAFDEDMYDHIQWKPEELEALRERGQEPIVFNVIQTTVNWVLGTQRRSPMDYKVLPRRKEGLEAAARKSELMRHLRDENYTEEQVAKAFGDAVKVGLGWLETGEGDPADGPIVFDRAESWRNMLWDSRVQQYKSFQDCRYVCRTKWLDLDIATALWPHRRGVLEISTETRMLASGLSDYGDEAMDMIEDDSNFVAPMTSGGQYWRDRIRCIEMWFKKPMNVPVMSGGDFSRELFDPWSKGHWKDLQDGRATLVERPREVIHVALFTEKGLLDVRQSPYRHNKFPFTPVWGYRRGRDGLPYGIIRGLRDIQRDLNKRASKALHHLSSTQVLLQEGAVDDIEELRTEAGRPDSVIVYKKGHDVPQIGSDHNLANAHVDLMSMDAQMIQQVGGVTDENLGRKTNATSGKAIVARQDQGALATAIFFDNLRNAMRHHGEKKLINIEQFYTDEFEFRITNARGNPEYVRANDGNPRNAIDMMKADFVMEEEDYRATTRQAEAEALLELMKELAATAPEIVIANLDLVIEALDVPKRDEIVKRIRQITGQADPDEDPDNPSPETLDMQKQKAAQAEMEKRAAEAEIGEKEAKAAKTKAEAARNWLGLRSDNVDQIHQAVDAAIKLGGAPAVAAAVDGFLRIATNEAEAMGMPGGQQPEPVPAPQQIPQQQAPMPDGSQPVPLPEPQPAPPAV